MKPHAHTIARRRKLRRGRRRHQRRVAGLAQLVLALLGGRCA